jgi:hypothetical protein
MTDKTWCCERFAEELKRYQAPVAGGLGLYPVEMRPRGQIEQAGDGSWNVNGCCGGGCYVLSEISHCPFCGSKQKRDS